MDETERVEDFFSRYERIVAPLSEEDKHKIELHLALVHESEKKTLYTPLSWDPLDLSDKDLSDIYVAHHFITIFEGDPVAAARYYIQSTKECYEAFDAHYFSLKDTFNLAEGEKLGPEHFGGSIEKMEAFKEQHGEESKQRFWAVYEAKLRLYFDEDDKPSLRLLH